jgi:hypothetical protein
MTSKPPLPSDKAANWTPAPGVADGASCPLPSPPNLTGIAIVPINPQPPVADYRAAMQLAEAEAAARLKDYMLLSWYDRDRNFEAPQHVSECHEASAVPGYVDYGIHHGATLKVDVEDGRFVFFYRPVEPDNLE